MPGRLPRRALALLLGALTGVTAAAAPARAGGGDVTEYPITTTADSLPAGIAAGPDGAVWFIQSGAARIGRIAADGTVTDHPTPSPGSAPFAIAPGPDHALWFTEQSAGRIGRITIPPGFGRNLS
ncbi:hypothetical protein ABZ357_27315 [Streptomyces sp. NPDC005917]|uniref:virginiamycin B lyase family protein n=1 Tax=unclassified Streptomyces TaxID=2593676 RepID=UPI0033C28ABC